MDRLKLILTEISSKNCTKITIRQNVLEEYGISNLTLRDYQRDGVGWMVERFHRDHGCILGDEMGLGKTCQTISFLVHLQGAEGVKEPHLVLCPLSVMQNWKDEFKRFAPKMRLLVYTGDKESRNELRSDIKRQKKKGEYEFDVLLTTYELCLKDEDFLRTILWHTLVVDEAHRLKNAESQLHQALVEFDIEHRVLLTGTPIQNKLAELYSLLSFVAPGIFKTKYRDDFLEKYETLSHVTQRTNQERGKAAKEDLHEVLKPFLLRRVKDEVVKDLPGKSEVVLYHGLSALQKKYYKAILLKDSDAFDTDRPSASRTRLLNILMQLRKCVNHPYLFDGVEPEPFEMGEHLVTASEKLVVIDRLLQHLRCHGHRVLLFSQMTRMLDILQDYLHFRGFSYERLDGSVRGEERFVAVNKFQKDTGTFVFLLSTRAGGQGLNLTGADTVIFVDSDFNPQNDLQAAARAHRIGQTKPVKIVRLVGRSTVEEIVLRRAESKLKLTRTVIEGGQFSTLSSAEAREQIADESGKLTDILKFGVDKLFENDSEYRVEIDIETILGTSEKGEWVETAVSDDLTEKKDDKQEKLLEEPAEDKDNNMYVFEGKDYSTEPSSDDKAKFDALIAAELASLSTCTTEERATKRRHRDRTFNASQLTPTLMLPEPERKPSKKLTPVQLEERRKKMQERKEERARQAELEEVQRAQERRQRRQKLWQDNDYETSNVQLDSEGDSDASSENGLDLEADEDIHYVKGDVTHPQVGSGAAIVVHCVDDSGRWGSGGLFTALDLRSVKPSETYTEAGKMKDLALGDCHLCHIDDLQSRKTGHDMCALIVAQHRDKKSYVLSGIKLSALEQGLRRIYKLAKSKKASVHLPRIGYNTPSFNWYGTERLIRRLLAARGVTTYIYYYDRNAARKRRTSTELDDSSSKARRTDPEPGTSRRDVTRPAANDDDVTMTMDAAAAEAAECLLEGLCVHFYNIDADDRKLLVRQVMKSGGDVHKTVEDSTTHIVYDKLGDDDRKALSNLCAEYEDLAAVGRGWLETSMKTGRVQATQKWLLESS